ncbi:MAG: Bro-N domain-containing protein [Beijerinckiaceae bacterium]
MTSTSTLTLTFNTVPVRVVFSPTGEPRFIAQDVARATGYSSSAAILRAANDEDILWVYVGHGAPVNAVTVPGIERVARYARKPAVRAFSEWVANAALPAINRAKEAA